MSEATTSAHVAALAALPANQVMQLCSELLTDIKKGRTLIRAPLSFFPDPLVGQTFNTD